LSAALEENIQKSAVLIQQADALVIAAGAGMGVDSGLPDFRGQHGFWNAYPALGRDRINFTSIASPEAFTTAVTRAWGFYEHRLALYRRTVPHEGFALLRHWSGKMPRPSVVFTSNVDGQFQKAGFNPERIHECHGSIHFLQCLHPCSNNIWHSDEFEPQVDPDTCRLLNTPPTCPRCGGLARPNILMFNDCSWLDSRERQQSSAVDHCLQQAANPVVIELGAGTAIPSVRNFTQRVVQYRNGRLIRINPTESVVSSTEDVGLPLTALQGLRVIAAALGDEWNLPPT